jgi:iron complex outermembrane receptor protein
MGMATGNFGRTLRLALLSGCAMGMATMAHAQATPPGSDDATVEAVVVTGSHIRGTPEDAALPVDVIGRDELERQGAPSTVDLIKSLPVSNGVLGDTNQFDPRANGAEGSGSINLRGLGSERTLVLLNGRRMATNPVANGGGGVVDTNLIPVAAIGRVEILKDGAAATYGSDAIGGVVNFITRTSQDGGEFGFDYRAIDASDGDYTAALSYGFAGDRWDGLLAAGYQHRSELRVLDRDFSNPEYLENPQGGYTAVGNPGSYIPLGAAFTAVGPTQRDVNCASVDGFAGFSGATPVCYSRSTQFDNLVEKEDRYQVFGSVNYRLTDKVSLYGEALYATTDVPTRVTSPSQSFNQTPTAEAAAAPNLAGRLFVPTSNPGYGAYVAANPGVFPVGTAGVQLVSYRPFFLGGNPLYGGTGGSQDSRKYEAFRLSGGIKGEFADGIRFDASLTYMEDKNTRTTSDVLVNRLQLALRGLGGPNCDSDPNTAGIQGTAGVGGCQYFNPFSNAVPRNSATGSTNPQYNAAVGNNNDVIGWFYQTYGQEAKTSLLVADLVFDGESGFELWGGKVGWALGAQYRKDTYETKVDDIYNTDVTPCVATPDFFVTNCVSQTGPFGFVGTSRPVDLSGDVYALFGELSLPVTKDIQVQLAARYEDYGGDVGSTFDPKLAVRWQVVDWLALRGSIGSTFRGPPRTSLDPNPQTSLQQVRGIYRTVDTYGDPGLQPETAVTYNVGFLIDTGGFKGSVDFWSFDFDNPITAEPIGSLASALYPTSATNRCLDPAYAAIRARFTFNDLNGNGTDDDCAAANIARVRTNVINGSPVQTTGLDFSASYLWDDVLGGRLTVGADATRVLNYDIDSMTIENVPVSAAFDAVGKLNYQTTAVPLPKWRGSAYFAWSSGPHDLRWTIRYIDGYQDQRTDIYLPSVNNSAVAGVAVALPQGKNIGRFITQDVTYRVQLPWEMSGSLTVENVFDEDPPFVRLNLSYDPFTANPLGRTIKIGLRKKF